ncbi:hypothetical protein [Lactiplantibacillus plantarum]|uniref:hypothetical protein n=1 Tax=Lactiplantibacillus plantarum TaxID=1590 RepID=UPI0021CB5C4B|nr:hypothetical protein [Lactiplantibacillus plantarum]
MTQPQQPLDMVTAGTAHSLIKRLLAGQPFETTLVGDTSLSQTADGASAVNTYKHWGAVQ